MRIRITFGEGETEILDELCDQLNTTRTDFIKECFYYFLQYNHKEIQERIAYEHNRTKIKRFMDKQYSMINWRIRLLKYIRRNMAIGDCKHENIKVFLNKTKETYDLLPVEIQELLNEEYKSIMQLNELKYFETFKTQLIQSDIELISQSNKK